MILRYMMLIVILNGVAFAQESMTPPLQENLETSDTLKTVSTNIAVTIDSSDTLASKAKVMAQALSRIEGKPNVAVLDFTGNYKHFSREEIQNIANRFETELIKTDSFTVLERRNMDAILQEQDFIQSDRCNSSECRTKVGQLLGVDFVITGELSKMDDMISLSIKMINVESGQNMKSHVLDINGNLQDVLRGGCFEMAQIFSGRKEPENNHSVLAVKKPSVIPWIVGGLGAIAIGLGAYFVLTQNDESAEDYTVNTGF